MPMSDQEFNVSLFLDYLREVYARLRGYTDEQIVAYVINECRVPNHQRHAYSQNIHQCLMYLRQHGYIV
jgi:hypothetical protein